MWETEVELTVQRRTFSRERLGYRETVSSSSKSCREQLCVSSFCTGSTEMKDLTEPAVPRELERMRRVKQGWRARKWDKWSQPGSRRAKCLK